MTLIQSVEISILTTVEAPSPCLIGSPCLNEGECLQRGDLEGYICECPYPFYGKQCQLIGKWSETALNIVFKSVWLVGQGSRMCRIHLTYNAALPC